MFAFTFAFLQREMRSCAILEELCPSFSCVSVKGKEWVSVHVQGRLTTLILLILPLGFSSGITKASCFTKDLHKNVEGLCFGIYLATLAT